MTGMFAYWVSVIDTGVNDVCAGTLAGAPAEDIAANAALRVTDTAEAPGRSPLDVAVIDGELNILLDVLDLNSGSN